MQNGMFPFETSNAHTNQRNTKLRTDAPVMNVPTFNIVISKSSARSRAKEFPLVLPTKKAYKLQGNRRNETFCRKLPRISSLYPTKNLILENNILDKLTVQIRHNNL